MLLLQDPKAKSISGDLIADPDIVARTLESEGPFQGVVHAVGMILPNSLNALASGSGSKPAAGMCQVLAGATRHGQRHPNPCPERPELCRAQHCTAARAGAQVYTVHATSDTHTCHIVSVLLGAPLCTVPTCGCSEPAADHTALECVLACVGTDLACTQLWRAAVERWRKHSALRFPYALYCTAVTRWRPSAGVPALASQRGLCATSVTAPPSWTPLPAGGRLRC